MGELDKCRPALLLTRQHMLPRLHYVTVAPITTQVRVGHTNCPCTESVISCDTITTLERYMVGERIGELDEVEEKHLTEAMVTAFDLR